MRPILLGPIRSYGVMLALGFLAGIFFALHRAKKNNIDPNKILDLSLWAIVSALAGARLLYVLSSLSYFKEHPLEIVFSRSGFSMTGGLIAAIIVSILYMHWKKLAIWKIADLLTPSIPLGESIGRIGCFLNGCCYGKATKSFLALKYPYLEGVPNPAPLLPRHPTQLYYSFFAVLTLVFLLSLEKRKQFEGEVFTSYLLLYSFLRFCLDFFRGDELDSLICGKFTIAQTINVFIFIFAIFLLINLRKKC